MSFSTARDVMIALRDCRYSLPEDALAAAEGMREAITPYLLQEFEACSRGKPSEFEDALCFVSYLLAYFRDIRALPLYRRIAENFSDDFVLSESLGLSSDGPRLVASWAFSDPGALRPLIASRKLDEIERNNVLLAHACLCNAGAVSAEYVHDYLAGLGDDELRQSKDDTGWGWCGWADCCLALGFDDLYPVVRNAFENGWIDPQIMDWEFFEQQIASRRDNPSACTDAEYQGLIGHVADEMRGWYCFTEQARIDDMKQREFAARNRAIRERKARAEEREAHKPANDDFVPVGTIVNSAPKPLPNKPCPCGSGKKYKKCCGR